MSLTFSTGRSRTRLRALILFEHRSATTPRAELKAADVVALVVEVAASFSTKLVLEAVEPTARVTSPTHKHKLK